MAADRFASVSDKDIEDLIAGAENENTAKATALWLRVVTEFRREKSLDICFATCTAEEFNEFLCRFYMELKPKKSDTEYARSSYLAARSALQRHVRVLKRPFDLYKGEAFFKSNQVLDAFLVKKKKDGKEPQVNHKQPLTDEDLARTEKYFEGVLTADDPRKLTQYCWFVMTVHFCLRGQELQASMRKEDLVFEEVDGKPSVRLTTDFLSKNCPGGIKGREFATAGRITAPYQVDTIKKLIEKSHPEIDRLFQRVRPSFKPSMTTWFMKAPLGHNLLGQMMARISESAGLSKRYTNHCLRATCIKKLRKAGFTPQEVCAVSGHKNPASLAQYDVPDDEDCEKMSSAIDVAISPSLAEKSTVDAVVSQPSDAAQAIPQAPGYTRAADPALPPQPTPAAFQLQAQGATIRGMNVTIQNLTYNMVPENADVAIGAQKKKRLSLKKKE